MRPYWQRNPATGDVRRSARRLQSIVDGKLVPWVDTDPPEGEEPPVGVVVDEQPVVEPEPVVDAVDALVRDVVESLVELEPEQADDDLVPVPLPTASKAVWIAFVLETEDVDEPALRAMSKAQIIERYGA